jgi:hypothetical protein
MQVNASTLIRVVKIGLAPCFGLALLVGCGESGPGVGAANKDSQVTVTKVAPLTPEEKRKTKGAARAASGTQPSGAE